MAAINPKYAQIIEREFRKAAPVCGQTIPDDATLRVEFTDEEEIVVTVNDVKWTMPIGSDDDGFMFENDAREMIDFDMPDDWLELEENGPW